MGRQTASACIASLALLLPACWWWSGKSKKTVEYSLLEESTAISNLAVVSPDNLFVWTAPSLSDSTNLVYSAKQWVEGSLTPMVSVWRSAVNGGAATKLVPAGQNEALVGASADVRSNIIGFSVDCQVFSANRTGIGGRTKHNSTGYCDFGPSLIPDNKQLLFSSCVKRDEHQCSYQDSNYIWRMNLDGTNLVQLRQGRDARISRDGTKISFSYGGDIWLMSIDGSEATNLLPSDGYLDTQPSFSPDGKWLVFTRIKKGSATGDVWVMRTNGSNVVQLTMNLSADGSAHWAPGGWIYFLSNRGPLINGKYPQRVWRGHLLGINADVVSPPQVPQPPPAAPSAALPATAPAVPPTRP